MSRRPHRRCRRVRLEARLRLGLSRSCSATGACCGLRSGSIRLCWRGWRRPSIADDHGSGGRAGVPGAGRDRYAQGVRRAFAAGAGGAAGGSVLRASVRLSRPARRADQGAVLGRSGSLPVRQAAGAGPVHLAAGARGRGDAEPGAAVDAARGDRLEGTPAHRSSDMCRLMIQYVVPSRYANERGMPIEGALLADDAEALRALIAAQAAELAAARAGLVAKALEIETLKLQIARLRRQTFGRSSEKLGQVIGQLELSLEELEEDQAAGERPDEPAAV